ncbi:hypothetical protein GPJ56_000437 [Histomonas meleagridis]|uniref:uncharacterized protein n=1 Tax=Histomonas meleagridis TaxID=135588 RepID=UPI0035599E52|nr:hypothetical protein GPJ56_000437 [Histomonas meleagridis]KAH0796523.1 hypothetical protein GO595_010416 [Histomonas meleagridis]
MTIDSIRQLSEDVKCQGYHELNTLEEVKSFSSRTPLFCLVARANAGDLEIKLPILRELSQNFIHHDIKFGLITEMSLYETFSHYPLTSFVYISPNLKFTSFRNDFTLQNLITFIYLHEQHPWDSPLPPITPSITYVGPTVDSNTRKHFLEYEAKYPFVHVNNINDPVLARSICQNTSSCFAVVDFNKFKSVRFEIDDNDEDQITNLMSQFEEEWKNIPILKRIKISAEISFALYSKVYYVVGMIIVIVVVAVIMFFMDMNREIEDTRIAKKEKKQKKH